MFPNTAGILALLSSSLTLNARQLTGFRPQSPYNPAFAAMNSLSAPHLPGHIHTPLLHHIHLSFTSLSLPFSFSPPPPSLFFALLQLLLPLLLLSRPGPVWRPCSAYYILSLLWILSNTPGCSLAPPTPYQTIKIFPLTIPWEKTCHQFIKNILLAFCCFVLFVTRSHLSQAGLEFVVTEGPLPPKCKDHRFSPPHLAYALLETEPRFLCLLDKRSLS